MITEPILQGHELESSAWLKIKAHLNDYLAERREYNDGRSLTDIETAVVRGEILAIKRLLRIGESPKEHRAPG